MALNKLAGLVLAYSASNYLLYKVLDYLTG
jgi:hypothetical protein